MNGAYRVPGANEVLNTDLQTRRVFRLVFFLRSGHVEYPKSLVVKPISSGMKTGGLVIKVVYLGVGKFGGGLGSVWVEEGDRFRLSNGWQGGRLPSASGVLRVATS